MFVILKGDARDILKRDVRSTKKGSYIYDLYKLIE